MESDPNDPIVTTATAAITEEQVGTSPARYQHFHHFHTTHHHYYNPAAPPPEMIQEQPEGGDYFPPANGPNDHPGAAILMAPPVAEDVDRDEEPSDNPATFYTIAGVFLLLSLVFVFVTFYYAGGFITDVYKLTHKQSDQLFFTFTFGIITVYLLIGANWFHSHAWHLLHRH